MKARQPYNITVCGSKPIPRLILILFIIQPLLDVFSYWLSALGMNNTPTLLLRFAVLAATAGAAFFLSDRKRVYLIFAAVAVAFGAMHVFACFEAATAAGEAFSRALMLDDLVNYVRVLQFPLFTLCFITFMKRDEQSVEAVKLGFIFNFVLIAAVELLSAATGTNPYTYPSMGLGVVGWFYFPNSQSAILCMMIPVVLNEIAKSSKKWALPLAAAVSFAELFFFATRLAYLGIFAIAAGLVFVWAVTKTLTKRKLAVMAICVVICGACIQLSPMHENQSIRSGSLEVKQQSINVLVNEGKRLYGDDGYQHLSLAYNQYCGGLVDKFGLERVAEYFDYSTDAADITYVRSIKMAYCKMLLDDMPAASKIFGMEIGSLTFEDYIYDVENDFHAMYFLFGIAGLALLLAFIGYFAVLVINALIKNAKRYFTPEAGAAGIALCMGLIHVYNTAGVLRRPNASFYLAVLLAIIYYLMKIKKYQDKQE